jgi:hypothetical protein
MIRQNASIAVVLSFLLLPHAARGVSPSPREMADAHRGQTKGQTKGSELFFGGVPGSERQSTGKIVLPPLSPAQRTTPRMT